LHILTFNNGQIRKDLCHLVCNSGIFDCFLVRYYCTDCKSALSGLQKLVLILICIFRKWTNSSISIDNTVIISNNQDDFQYLHKTAVGYWHTGYNNMFLISITNYEYYGEIIGFCRS